MKKKARSFLKVKMREELLRLKKKREMGNSHQSGKNKRLGTYCTMRGCVKYPPEAHSHEFEMRPVISVVHFPPILASCTGTGIE